MTCQTRSWHFYWERLGYESNDLPTKGKDVVGGSPSYPPTEYAKTCRTEQTSRKSTEVPRDKDSMD